MDLKQLTATGLTRPQAEAYIYLLEKGSVTPPRLAAAKQLTRTNAYKILDKLTELGLAVKHEKNKKFTYQPTSPMALANLSAQLRAEAVAREEAVSGVIHELLAQFQTHSTRPDVQTASGQKEVASLYRKQLNLREDIYFIHTKADIPMMGFDTMHELRVTPSRHGNQRKGILVRPDNGLVNKKQHERSNLEITWVDKDQYNEPVEWSATKSSLLIVSYATAPHAMLITDPFVATAFIQIWQLLDCHLKPFQPTIQ